MGLFSSHKTYINKEGEEVPSVTTILKIINKPALTKWANIMGFKRINTDNVLKRASAIGTATHYCIECLVGKTEFQFPKEYLDYIETVTLRMKGFKEFLETVTLEPISLELEFASDRYGGTIDYYGKMDDKTVILDWKTSGSVHSSMFLQLGGYLHHLETEGNKIDGCGIVHVTEKGSVLHYKTRDEMQKYIDAFLVILDFFHVWYQVNKEDGWKAAIV